MSNSDLKFTEEHEWVSIEDGIATIGITTYAVDELGEIVFAELPKTGTQVSQMDEFGSLESVKTVSSLFAPIGGEVIESNQIVEDDCSIISDSPYDSGWLIKIKIDDEKEIDDLMSKEEYDTYIETL